ncbi:MAG: hypothetical protein R2806_22495 [Saprospiraceae bacterium]
MKFLGLISTLLFSISLLMAQNLKPYILGLESNESITILKDKLKSNFQDNGISVVGQNQPANDQTRWILVITSSELQNAVKSVGGLTGFAVTLRVAVTMEEGTTKVSYTNPAYWGNTYFRTAYDQVTSHYQSFSSHLKQALEACGPYIGTEFGSKKGLSPEDLRKYHYMMGMPYFDDTELLGTFNSYQDAINNVEASLSQGVPGV